MKEGLMWFVVVAILGTIIPSKGWLAVFVLVVCALGFLLCALDDRQKAKEKLLRGEYPPTPAHTPPKPVDPHTIYKSDPLVMHLAQRNPPLPAEPTAQQETIEAYPTEQDATDRPRRIQCTSRTYRPPHRDRRH